MCVVCKSVLFVFQPAKSQKLSDSPANVKQNPKLLNKINSVSVPGTIESFAN